MGSEKVIQFDNNADVVVEASIINQASSNGKKNHKKVPKRIHKAEREKQKRDHLNDLFFELSNSLDMKQPNNGKASVLCEATRILKDLLDQIESLRKENVSLLSESRYVTVEKDELREENSTLETQIGKLQNELESRAAHSKPDLNAPPLECVSMQSQEPSLGQTHAVFFMPLGSGLQSYTSPKVSKPHARYPTSRDSWPPQLLRDHPKDTRGFGDL